MGGPKTGRGEGSKERFLSLSVSFQSLSLSLSRRVQKRRAQISTQSSKFNWTVDRVIVVNIYIYIFWFIWFIFLKFSVQSEIDNCGWILWKNIDVKEYCIEYVGFFKIFRASLRYSLLKRMKSAPMKGHFYRISDFSNFSRRLCSSFFKIFLFDIPRKKTNERRLWTVIASLIFCPIFFERTRDAYEPSFLSNFFKLLSSKEND